MDKQKQIEEMAKILDEDCGDCHKCNYYDNEDSGGIECIFWLYAERIYNANYRKIPEGAVVIPKEISYHDNIEKAVVTAKLYGKKVDFTAEQIMALTTIFHYEELREKEKIRKETAEKFTEMAKRRLDERRKFCFNKWGLCEKRDETEMSYYWNGKVNEIDMTKSDIDEICKEITEV